jgi:hypothetical protein
MIAKHLSTFVAVSLACTVVWGCRDARTHSFIQPSAVITGSGRVVSESRPVSGFSAIAVSLPARVVIVQSGTESLSVTAEDNILPLVQTEVVGGRLVIGLASPASISATRGILVEVQARAIAAVDADDASRVEFGGLQADRLSVHASGASEVMGSGAARELRLDVSGAVRCQLAGIATRTASATVSGTSYALLRVADSLVATASGLSVVEYYGDPVVVSNVSGVSAVRRLGS